MGELLGLFEGKALHRALVEAGHEVSVRTVQRWVAGDTPPKSQDMAAIRRLLELPAPAAAPEWAEKLERKLDVLVARAGVDPVDAEDEAEARRLVAAALAQRERAGAEP